MVVNDDVSRLHWLAAASTLNVRGASEKLSREHTLFEARGTPPFSSSSGKLKNDSYIQGLHFGTRYIYIIMAMECNTNPLPSWFLHNLNCFLP